METNFVSSKDLVLAVTRQFSGSFKMFRQAIKNIPEEMWYRGSKSWSFAWTAFHVVECADALSQIGSRDFIWLSKIGLTWAEIKDGEEFKNKVLPKITKELVADYLNDVESSIISLLEGMIDEDLHAPDESGKAEGLYETVFERMIYLLRHQQHHVGELALALREWECKRMTWESK